MHISKLYCLIACSCLMLLAACPNSFASNWVRWDANEFPENFQYGGVFENFGGGSSRHIIEYPGQNGQTNYTYSVYSALPSHGYFQRTTGGSWMNANSTLEFRLKVCSYCGDMSVCNDPNVQGVFGIEVFDLHSGKVSGFFWRKTAAEKAERITAVESSNNYINFKNQNRFYTYRMFYDANASQAKLYYWDSEQNQWNYLLTSSGFVTTVDADALWAGDWSLTMAGQYELDYQRWTNDGLITRPEFCGDTGTIYLNGDANRDCQVNLKDLLVIVNCWLGSTEPGTMDVQTCN